MCCFFQVSDSWKTTAVLHFHPLQIQGNGTSVSSFLLPFLVPTSVQYLVIFWVLDLMLHMWLSLRFFEFSLFLYRTATWFISWMNWLVTLSWYSVVHVTILRGLLYCSATWGSLPFPSMGRWVRYGRDPTEQRRQGAWGLGNGLHHTESHLPCRNSVSQLEDWTDP